MASSNQPGGRRATIVTVIVGLAIAAIYLFNTNLLGFLIPGLVGTSGDSPPAIEQSAAPAAESSTQGAQPPPQAEPSAAVEPTSTSEPAAVEATSTSAPAAAEAAPAATMPARVNGVPTIAYEALPPQAHDTLALIEQGGPFPYDQDGSVFQNREGILPGRPRGYYREYTVETPGSDDRGARRLVEGAEGEIYYTDDHYDSFSYVWLQEE